MAMSLLCGIESEYLIVDGGGAAPGRVRDFTNLPFEYIRGILEDKPGRADPHLATGDLGIRSGYWYLEGDERFHPDGRFREMVVKGVEIRTPPHPGVTAAISTLLEIEDQLTAVLARHRLGLAIAGFNPVRPGYSFEPPLNAWELAQRREDPSFDGAAVYTLSYGPDINLSWPDWTPEQGLDTARKLNWYSPYLVPFSFSSPFYAGSPWTGLSKRTFERAAWRPAVKLFLAPAALAALAPGSRLVHPVRLDGEAGRIEYKAFDAPPSLELLTACCHLLVGLCLADDLPERGEGIDLSLFRRAALHGFMDAQVRAGAVEVLSKAKRALSRVGETAAAQSLAPLEDLLAARQTPSHALLAEYRKTGSMLTPGGYRAVRPRPENQPLD